MLQQDPSLDWVAAGATPDQRVAASTVVAADERAWAAGRLPVPLTPLIGREMQSPGWSSFWIAIGR